MSVLDLIVPTHKVVIQQEQSKNKKVELELKGLNTADFLYLYDTYGESIVKLFFGEEEVLIDALAQSKHLAVTLPELSAAIIACGCGQKEASAHIQNLPLLTQIELLSTVMYLTIPEAQKKSRWKLKLLLPALKN